MPALLYFACFAGIISSALARFRTTSKDLRWTRRDSLDVLQAIRWYCEAYDERSNRAYLPQKRHFDRAKQLVGLWLQPPYNDGTQDHLRGKNWKDNLARAGIDPETRHLVDIEKLEIELRRLDQRDYERHILEEEGERRTSVAKLKKEYSDAQPKLPLTKERLLIQEYMTDQVRKLGRDEYGEIQRNPQDGLTPSRWPKKIAPVDDYEPGRYGTPIDDDDKPRARRTAPTAKEIKRRYRLQQGGPTF